MTMPPPFGAGVYAATLKEAKMVVDHCAKPDSFMYQVSQALLWADKQLQLARAA